ncbi:MAG: MGMT family protein [Methanoregulaceae archaeon]|jgi:methylated-DNA-[protein]-cysteine S-methyltransferase|nr:MGMT family protein [Methanoregulaceae archaeon]
MEVIEGSTRFGLWYVHVRWKGTTIYHVRFSRIPVDGPVPVSLVQYLSGREVDLSTFICGAVPPGEHYARIYREVQQIPYGETATYSEVAERAGTHPRVVGQALSRNLLPLIIPCHRVVSRSGIGGFTPDPAIKEELLKMEGRGKRRSRRKTENGDES